MACSSNNVRDIESFILNDKQFNQSPHNIHKYEEFGAYTLQGLQNDKLLNKICINCKRGDIIVKKSFLVYVYQKMIKEKQNRERSTVLAYVAKMPQS